MNIRYFDKEKDYEDVYDWWNSHEDWTPIPKEMLGDDGFIVEKEGKKLVAVWVYSTSCPIYIMEWLVSNPDTTWEERNEAIDMAIECCVMWCKKEGGKILFTMTKNERLLEKLQNNNFNKTEDNMTHLIRSV